MKVLFTFALAALLAMFSLVLVKSNHRTTATLTEYDVTLRIDDAVGLKSGDTVFVATPIGVRRAIVD